MTTRSAPKKGSQVTTAKSLLPKTATAPRKRTTTKKKTAPPAPAPAVIPSGDEPQDAPRPLSEEQRSLDLLTRVELALGIQESAILGKQGLIAAHNLQIARADCLRLLHWLERGTCSAPSAPPIKLGQLSTALSEPPKESSRGAFPIYGSDMYTLVCYRRGPLWFVAAYNYELDIPYLDFKTWENDLLSALAEVGL